MYITDADRRRPEIKGLPIAEEAEKDRQPNRMSETTLQPSSTTPAQVDASPQIVTVDEGDVVSVPQTSQSTLAPSASVQPPPPQPAVAAPTAVQRNEPTAQPLDAPAQDSARLEANQRAGGGKDGEGKLGAVDSDDDDDDASGLAGSRSEEEEEEGGADVGSEVSEEEEEEEEEEEAEKPAETKKPGDAEPTAKSMMAKNPAVAESLKATITVDPEVARGAVDDLDAGSSVAAGGAAAAHSVRDADDHLDVEVGTSRARGAKPKRAKTSATPRKDKKKKKKKQQKGARAAGKDEESDGAAEGAEAVVEEEEVDEEEAVADDGDSDVSEPEDAEGASKKKREEAAADSDEGEGDEIVRRARIMQAIKEYRKTVPNGPQAEIGMPLHMLRQIKKYYKDQACTEFWAAAFAYGYVRVIGGVEVLNERFDPCKRLIGMSLKLRGASESVESNLSELRRPMLYYGKKIAKMMESSGSSPLAELIFGTVQILKNVHGENVKKEAYEAMMASVGARGQGPTSYVRGDDLEAAAQRGAASNFGAAAQDVPEFVPQQVYAAPPDSPQQQQQQTAVAEPAPTPAAAAAATASQGGAQEQQRQPEEAINLQHPEAPEAAADGGEPIDMVHGEAEDDADIASSAAAEEAAARGGKGKQKKADGGGGATRSQSSSSEDDDGATTATSVYKIDMGGAKGKGKRGKRQAKKR